MRHLVKMLLIMLILGFVASGVPIYFDAIDITQEPGNETDHDIQQELSVDIDRQSENQVNVQLSMDLGFLDEELHPELDRPFSAELYAAGEHIQTLDPQAVEGDFSFQGEPDQKVFQGTWPLTQKNLDVPDGQYEVRIQMKTAPGEALGEEAAFSLTLSSTTTYREALYEKDPGETALTLYFPDEQQSHLIPVTRFVPQTHTTLRETVEQLRAGPHPEMGLPEGSPIPPVPRIQLAQGITTLYMERDLGEYNETPKKAETAVTSLIESLGSIPEVTEIHFRFNQQRLEEGFQGIRTDGSFEASTGPCVYAGYLSPADRMLIMPRFQESSPTSVDEMIERLAFSKTAASYGYRVQPAIPAGVTPNGYTLEDGVLTLQLNDHTDSFLTENPAYASFMMDSLLLSLTSLEEVEAVVVDIEGLDPGEMTVERGMEQPAQPPVYLNPEP